MSCVRCMGCSDIIDTDYDVECYRDESGDMVYCDPCWDDRVCKTCGEKYADCDDDCHQCLAAKYISGEESLADDMEIFSAIDWLKGGYAKCLQLVWAARREVA